MALRTRHPADASAKGKRPGPSDPTVRLPSLLTRPERVAKRNIPVAPVPLRDFTLSGRLLRERTPGGKKESYIGVGDLFATRALNARATHGKIARKALKDLHRRGIDPGPLISGIISDKFPATTKDQLRRSVANNNLLTDAAFAYYSAGRLQNSTARQRFQKQ